MLIVNIAMPVSFYPVITVFCEFIKLSDNEKITVFKIAACCVKDRDVNIPLK